MLEQLASHRDKDEGTLVMSRKKDHRKIRVKVDEVANSESMASRLSSHAGACPDLNHCLSNLCHRRPSRWFAIPVRHTGTGLYHSTQNGEDDR